MQPIQREFIPQAVGNQYEYRGLTSAEAASQLKRFGYNRIPQKKALSWWQLFLRQFKDALIYILIVALLIDILVWIIEGANFWPVDAIAIALILIFNALLGAWQESKAENALMLLKHLTVPKIWVMRDASLTQIVSEELVPDDIIRIDHGERIPADLELLEDTEVLVDESILTGESVPLLKTQYQALLAGTLVVQGCGYFKVTNTGPASALGQLAKLISQIESVKTPLEKRLEIFSKKIGIVILLIAATLFTVSLWAEGLTQFKTLFLFAIALAVAAVPEGLPAIISLTLALGVERMAKRKAVVRKMAAVEALGSVTVVATDKTGTLTENQMLVKQLITANEPLAFRAMSLANDADTLSNAGDPLEQGLYRFLKEKHHDPHQLKIDFPRVSSRPFDSRQKFMRVSVAQDNAIVSYFKGAPEVLIARCELTDLQKDEQHQLAEKFANEGFRVLALAWRKDELETGLNWLGLVLFWDPPRVEVPDAIDKAQRAGIRVIMLTGDHPATALTIAKQIGIKATVAVTGNQLEAMDTAQFSQCVLQTNIFARVKPEHKLAIVKILQQQHQIVAVTGDGVNDAPALKAADVGIAMGQRGSDVSREVADMVLMDDNFATIINAIEEGRSIYANIKKFIRILFSANLSEVILVAVGTATAIGMDIRYPSGELMLPLLAVQILWINLLTDSLPALTVALDRNPRLMYGAARPGDAPLLDSAAMTFILVIGLFIGLTALGLLYGLMSIGVDLNTVQTIVFCHLTIAQLCIIAPARKTLSESSPNYYLWLVILVCFGLQYLVLEWPMLNTLLHVSRLNGQQILLIVLMALASWLCAELTSRIIRRQK